jgi:hypothetical protein
MTKKRQESEPILWDTIKDERNQKALARQEYWHLKPELFEAILKILFQRDPMGICNHDTGTSEYCAEANAILPRLGIVTSVEDVQKIVHEEFVNWFGATGERKADRYEALAKDIWELLQEKK